MDGRLRLYQYWDTGAPPAEVAALMDGWAADPAYDHRPYSRAQAVEFLAARFPAAVGRAFAQCRYPAMQADLFRYCILFAEGGLYLDADTANGGAVRPLLARADRGALMVRQGKVANDFLYAAQPGAPLFAAVIDRAVANIERRVSNNVWQVTGPGILTGLRHDPGAAHLFAGFRFLPVEEVRKVVHFRWDLDYKRGGQDWRDALASPDRSIFM